MSALFPIMVPEPVRPFFQKLRQAGVPCALVGLSWSIIGPHERQAQINHDQTLQRLAERGGLSPAEALAVLENRSVRSQGNRGDLDEVEATRQLMVWVKAWQS